MTLFYLNRVRLNKSGYDRSGRYFGIGQPIFYMDTACDNLDSEPECMLATPYAYIRAENREAAKDKIREDFKKFHPRFFR